MKLLIADDNPVWRNLISAAVENWGYRIESASDGNEAYGYLRSEDPPRLALLDWLMPGMEGVEICRRIKQDPEHPFTYIILLTSRDRDEDMIQGLDAGADDYLTKPIVAPLLKSRLAAARRIIEAVPPMKWTKPQIEGFEIDHLIGRGAFATVWKGTHRSSGKPTAIKIIRADLATDLVFERFAREIQVMRKMDHPGIASIYASHLERDLAYYAMELVEGESLANYIASEAPRATRIIEMMAKVCDALQHAHDHGVIHRDVKPSNIMVGKDGQPKLVDFGLSKSMFRTKLPTSNSSTHDGAVLGTPLYMSPEQARGDAESVDHRSDLYAVATMLYLFLLREHPHGALSMSREETIHAIATTSPRPATEVNPKFNPQLEAILSRCLADNPDDRPQTAGQLAKELREFLNERAASRSQAPRPRSLDD
ncbi:protein kinase domain-containing protein [Rhodopirellula halodulae]|uniref:protein kinase domain-containing protein n=1 Tax=Rhodopirellula halodulae TaxID=2894198 RepID=UPI001E5E2CB3|nr:protein kinase [Rhodopirellula sp. JC737]MCC9654393.1 protein kinase [Rhodopirellula sp. JC737]